MPKLPNDPEVPPIRRASFVARARTNFLAGLVVVAPIGLTIWLIWTVVGWVDGFVLPFVPDIYQPEEIVNRWFRAEGAERIIINVRGVGVVFFLLFTIQIGWMAKGYIGRSFLRWGEGMVARMPVVRSIYNGVKQFAETVFATSENNFEKACLIEYPRKGIWAIGFISTTTKGEVAAKPDVGPMVSIFLPTTPNPTSGFLLFLPASDVMELDMTIEEAAKLIISAGLIYPAGTEEPPVEIQQPEAAE